jgi:hemerythrin
MDALKWSQTFETGVTEIDDDHRHLFRLADAVRESIVKEDMAQSSTTLQHFIDAAQQHFVREERILAQLGFPDLAAHKVYHSSLVAKARQLRLVCDIEVNAAKADACYTELVAFLIDDVVRGDSQFKSYLQHYGSDRS